LPEAAWIRTVNGMTAALRIYAIAPGRASLLVCWTASATTPVPIGTGFFSS